MPPIGGWNTGVYQIRNLVNGKVYVGSTAKSFRNRFAYHRQSLRGGYCHNRHLQSAWFKYGSKAFRFHILERCSPVLCLDKEEGWIIKLHATDVSFGYNFCEKARSNLGIKRSKETCEKIAASIREKWKDPDFHAKASKINLGRKHTGQALRNIQEARKCCKVTVREYTDEDRLKIAEQVRQQWKSESHRLNVVTKNREAALRQWADPERRAKHREAMVEWRRKREESKREG